MTRKELTLLILQVIVLGTLCLLAASNVDGQYLPIICRDPSCAMCNSRRAYNASVSVQLRRQAQRAADTEPTPHVVVERILPLMKLTKTDTLVDIGAGDARVLIAARKQFGCKAVGIEIDAAQVSVARRNIGRLDIQIIHGDSTKATGLEDAVVFSYMWPAVTARMVDKLLTAKRVVSYQHQIEGLPMRAYAVGGGTVYVYERDPPALVE